jgi:hypothetical protein
MALYEVSDEDKDQLMTALKAMDIKGKDAGVILFIQRLLATPVPDKKKEE